MYGPEYECNFEWDNKLKYNGMGECKYEYDQEHAYQFDCESEWV